jgi:hypothetical protein
MSTEEDLREDAKRVRWEEKHPPFEEECQMCGQVDRWTCIGVDPAYGADADGRRGIRLTEYECTCGNLISVTE